VGKPREFYGFVAHGAMCNRLLLISRFANTHKIDACKHMNWQLFICLEFVQSHYGPDCSTKNVRRVYN
jgi:hypothetical protein